MTLSQVPRELAERLVPHPQTCTEQYCTCTGWLIENRFRVEAVIREAMQKALEAAVKVCEKAEFWRSDFDVSRPGIRAAIRSLSPVASAVTAETKEYESNEQRQATPSQNADFTGNEDSSSAKAVPILQASDVSENNPTRSVDDYQEVPILSVRKEPDPKPPNKAAASSLTEQETTK